MIVKVNIVSFSHKEGKRHFYNCLIDNKSTMLVVGDTLARMIGNKTGIFVIVKELKENYPCYDKSHFEL